MTRRRLTIAAAIAGLLVLVPLIGWLGYRGALATARAWRPPARVRYLAGAAAGMPKIVVEYSADDAKLYIAARYDDGTGRFTYRGGGPGTGDWDFRHAGAYARDGTLVREVKPAGTWLALDPGQSATLAAFREADGTVLTLRAWCLPEELTDAATIFDAAGTMIHDGDAEVEAWIAAHPPPDDL